ncbi:AraC family transcriptional regulator [Vibrio nigripulchritudo]|uniref:AraC family transcriptional regulator n=1 Tax=Vibrio nigripulchritudo TaxID=28173 RepID=UPI0003B22FA6|nr:AraC family transcriptional regulator [Vibrio nigripulchritudo]CCN70841.1 putative ARAC FAMILY TRANSCRIPTIONAL REGULATORY PROTEIN [Vibrio nigripulchritudo SFn118]
MGWLKRLNLVLEYIEENLDGEISIDEAAKIAYCSRYHFHRVFYAYFNVTFAEYVRRRKFTLAAVDVVSGQEKIIDIASRYGYDSPNAFTRAFRSVHGVNPSDARTSQVKIATYNRASFPSEAIGVEKMDYKIVERPSFNVVGKSKSFKFDDFTKNGQKFWKEYVKSNEYKALCQLTNGRPGTITGAPLLTVYFPSEADKLDEFLDLLGIEFIPDTNSEEFEVHTVPTATYAEFECTYQSAMKTNRYIYGEWFSATGYERDGDKPDVVAYFPMPYRHFSEMGVRWWVPVVKKE